MKGISQEKAKQNSIKYKEMYEQWRRGHSTLQQIGEQHDITKQRVWQIITRCKLGEGEYYVGVDVARNKWLEYKELYTTMGEARRGYKTWLETQDIKVAADNNKTAPHTGWSWN